MLPSSLPCDFECFIFAPLASYPKLHISFDKHLKPQAMPQACHTLPHSHFHHSHFHHSHFHHSHFHHSRFQFQYRVPVPSSQPLRAPLTTPPSSSVPASSLQHSYSAPPSPQKAQHYSASA